MSSHENYHGHQADNAPRMNTGHIKTASTQQGGIPSRVSQDEESMSKSHVRHMMKTSQGIAPVSQPPHAHQTRYDQSSLYSSKDSQRPPSSGRNPNYIQGSGHHPEWATVESSHAPSSGPSRGSATGGELQRTSQMGISAPPSSPNYPRQSHHRSQPTSIIHGSGPHQLSSTAASAATTISPTKAPVQTTRTQHTSLSHPHLYSRPNSREHPTNVSTSFLSDTNQPHYHYHDRADPAGVPGSQGYPLSQTSYPSTSISTAVGGGGAGAAGGAPGAVHNHPVNPAYGRGSAHGSAATQQSHGSHHQHPYGSLQSADSSSHQPQTSLSLAAPSGPVSYVGEMLGALFHGKGTLTYHNSGVIFEGIFNQGKKDGYGKMMYPVKIPLPTGKAPSHDSTASETITYIIVEALFENDQIIGEAMVKYPDGDQYVGMIREGKMHGKGKYYYASAMDTYEGQWKNGYRDGFGIMSFYTPPSNENDSHGNPTTKPQQQQERYEGQWKRDQFHGKGKYYHIDQSYYDGEWRHGKMHGYGRFVYVNGNIYEGYFENDMKNGQGTLTYARGGKYTGNWVDDVASGQGVVEYEAGEVYTGSFASGMKHGPGRLTLSDGQIIEGVWSNDVLSGHTIIAYTDGSRFDGETQNDVREGFGILFDATSKTRYEGQFCNNRRHGHGKIVFPDGSYAQGLFIDGQIDEEGLKFHFSPTSIWNNPDF